MSQITDPLLELLVDALPVMMGSFKYQLCEDISWKKTSMVYVYEAVNWADMCPGNAGRHFVQQATGAAQLHNNAQNQNYENPSYTAQQAIILNVIVPMH